MLDFHAYLERLASAEPTPGGGSAAALVGTMSAALIAMVARVTLANAKLSAVHAQASALAIDADALRTAFLAARPLDEAAYSSVIAAQSLPRADDDAKAERTRTLQSALTLAAAAPLETAELAAQALAQCERAARLHNAHLMSDVDCAARFARATLDAAVANVTINHRFIKDAAIVAAQAQRLTAILDRAHDHESATLAIVAAE